MSDVENETAEDDAVSGDALATDDSDRALPSATAVAVLEYLARALVASPDEVRVEVDDRDGLTLNVYVADGDMGRVIGKRGRVANAVRSVGRAAAARDGQSGVAIEFVD
ncbi:KH domain-containing protein [Iamia sp.]|uniref:KH domain-containing protein n=1 Tax=Iamia sp. TaxID=2722710 RepID=UPI002C3E6BA3|nr:KH domain-containing protein [Iamia sp.]HXH56710.1 KH domain-containing protein [Iamia sp.]